MKTVFNYCLFFTFLFKPFSQVNAQSVEDKTPLQIAQLIADNIVSNTEFEFKYRIQPVYPDAEVIDFGNTYGTCSPGVGYALSTLFSEVEQQETIQVGHADGIKIWINDQLVYEKKGNFNLPIVFDEKTYLLPEKFDVKLKKGANKILVKSECRADAQKWIVILQSKNLGRYFDNGKQITASLKEYAPEVNLCNWLIVGPFPNPSSESTRKGIDQVYPPETAIELYKMYKSDNKMVTWNIPRINIIAENPEGGKYYSWNYHVGCTMWGLQKLSQVTGNSKYNDYVTRWCDYTLSTIPLADYQTKILHAYRSSNWSVIHRPMLDYTTAPAMPLLTRLVYEKEFENRKEYVSFAEAIIDYASNKQFRMPNGVFAREYTIDPTVWADDMFIGIPWLLYAAEYIEDPVQKKKYHDDAASQILGFSKYLFDEDEKLFRQACYPNKPELKVPFWSRGNGWAIWAVSEVLLHLPNTHPKYYKILSLYHSHVKGIVRHQDEKGFWHNLVNVPETVRESSGAAIFTMAIARGINQGWLNKKEYLPIVEKSWNALKTFIDESGNINGVKGGTNFSTDPEDYAKTPLKINDTHGVLPLIFACFEVEKCLLIKK